jgi:hypothetical protein
VDLWYFKVFDFNLRFLSVWVCCCTEGRMINECVMVSGMRIGRKTEVLRQNPSQCHCIHHKCYVTNSATGQYSWKPAANLLSYGLVCYFSSIPPSQYTWVTCYFPSAWGCALATVAFLSCLMYIQFHSLLYGFVFGVFFCKTFVGSYIASLSFSNSYFIYIILQFYDESVFQVCL